MMPPDKARWNAGYFDVKKSCFQCVKHILEMPINRYAWRVGRETTRHLKEPSFPSCKKLLILNLFST